MSSALGGDRLGMLVALCWLCLLVTWSRAGEGSFSVTLHAVIQSPRCVGLFFCFFCSLVVRL